jgi:hypothetical protein
MQCPDVAFIERNKEYSSTTGGFTPISLEMPVPSQGHCGFHSFPVVDWFCLFIYLWVLTFPL